MKKARANEKKKGGTQEAAFLNGEGDQWFKRNAAMLSEDVREDPALWLIEQYGLKPKKVLEIGCSNGWRLAALQKKYGSTCVGVDPSMEALRDGAARFPALTLKRGLASDIPLKETFDLVVINFVMLWIAREELTRSISEIDRMVADGGSLLICDCDTSAPRRVRYHHLPEEDVWTYKANYDAMFTATTLYTSLARFTFSHSDHSRGTGTPEYDRAFAALLKKSIFEQYLPNS